MKGILLNISSLNPLHDRDRVLAQFPPIRPQLDLDEALQFANSEPSHRRVSHVRTMAAAAGRKLIQPLAGFSEAEEHREALSILRDEGTADILPTQVDSQTRNLQFEEIERMMNEKVESRARLNGYPIVNHGVETTRTIVRSVDRPIELRIGTTDPRLAAEVAFASGISSITAGPLYYLVHYSSETSVAESIRNWQYVFDLAALYASEGSPIGLQIHGLGNSTPFPPSLLGVGAILECLLAAERGCRHFAVDSRVMGNLRQDVASLRSIRDTVNRYLTAFGYEDAVVTMVRKSWGGRYPDDEARAFALISYTAVSGMLAGADEFISNSVEERFGIPTPGGNAATMRAIRHTIDLLSPQDGYPEDDPAFLEEYDGIVEEIDSIMSTVLDLASGDLARGIERAFDLGAIDVPFAASPVCRGEVITARDATGAVRFVKTGRLPFGDGVRQKHERAMRERLSRDARSVYDVVVSDIFSISEGPLVEFAGP